MDDVATKISKSERSDPRVARLKQVVITDETPRVTCTVACQSLYLVSLTLDLGGSPVANAPLLCPSCNSVAYALVSPDNIRWQPSRSDTWRFDACRILMSASLSPGTSRSSLIRRMIRRGLISAPAFSSRPRMKAVDERSLRLRSARSFGARLTWFAFGIPK
jgi:hypothetical protein